jgi:hypothetical protein
MRRMKWAFTVCSRASAADVVAVGIGKVQHGPPDARKYKYECHKILGGIKHEFRAPDRVDFVFVILSVEEEASYDSESTPIVCPATSSYYGRDTSWPQVFEFPSCGQRTSESSIKSD